MPGGDRTGPRGMGAMTGRAAGFCTGNPVPGYVNRGPGMGYGAGGRGAGRGGGRGWRNRYWETGLTGWQRAGFGAAAPEVQYSGQQELALLKEQAEYFENSLEGIKKRIGELEAKSSQPSDK